MKTLVRNHFIFMMLPLFLTACENPFKLSPSGKTLTAAPVGFAEGGSTTSNAISPVWAAPDISTPVDKYTLQLFIQQQCGGIELFSLHFGNDVTSTTISISSSGTYSFRVKTYFANGSERTSTCSDDILVSVTAPAPTPPPAPTLVPLFPILGTTGSGDLEFGASYMSGFAIAKNGHYLIGDPGNTRIQVIDPTTGLYVTSFTSPNLSDIQEIAVDPNGNIFAIGYSTGKVLKYDENYNLLAEGNIGTPVGLSLDLLGNVYVTSYTSHIVQKFDNNLNDLGTFASGFTYAGNSAFDADGNMWIANSYASQVLKLDSSGAVILTIASPLVFPRSVVVLPNGNIAVSDASYITYIFDADTGLLLSQFAMPGSNPSYPWSSSIAKYVMPDGDMILFYYESGVYQINKFKVDGTIVSF